MTLDSSACLAIAAWCAWYAAAAMVLLYGVYRMLTDDEVKQLAHQVAVVMRYAQQSNLFLETLKAELQTVPSASDVPSQSIIGRAYNRRKDDDQTKGD